MLKLADTKIQDVDFSQEVIICHQTDKVADILTVLKLKNIGSVVIIGMDNKVKGIFTQRDYLLKVPNQGPEIGDETIEKYMDPNPLKLYPDSNLSGAITSLGSTNSRYVVLVDDDEAPVGVLSQSDIIKYLAKAIKELES